MRRPRRELEAELDDVLRVVTDRTGLDLTGCHRDRMVDTVRQAWLDAGAPRPDRYEALVDGTPVWARLVDRLTVGETYFFRHPEQLEAVVAAVRAVVRAGRRARVWSAGCATGEEPYTVAILLAQEGLLERCEILGTDLSPRAIQRARTASYSRWSLRRCDDEQQSAYFERDGSRFRLRERYVEAVTFRTHNLVDAPPAAGAFDVVLCRNVLMYLSPEALDAASVALSDALCRDGKLFLGPSDPIGGAAGLKRVPNGPPVTLQRATATVADIAVHRLLPAAPVMPTTPVRPSRPEIEAEPAWGDEPETGVEGIAAADIEARLADGDLAAATALLARALATDPLDASLQYLAATLHLESGDPEAAATAARAAVYLDGSLAAAHFVLGQAEHRRGNRDRARRSFRNTVEALSALPPDAAVPLAGGRTASSLSETAAVLADR